ncbi:hypothetical protein NM688_g4948 [Phlebia brevispora]|uniref:Uncharacterized protein n=1 Tax=Phlebia brevispora TaxID=194682 RepID=A0ACC1T1Q8_9APHY|nr:hypothetical protein NM688_g4948 [Phlebia brevispora]
MRSITIYILISRGDNSYSVSAARSLALSHGFPSNATIGLQGPRMEALKRILSFVCHSNRYLNFSCTLITEREDVMWAHVSWPVSPVQQDVFSVVRPGPGAKRDARTLRQPSSTAFENVMSARTEGIVTGYRAGVPRFMTVFDFTNRNLYAVCSGTRGDQLVKYRKSHLSEFNTTPLGGLCTSEVELLVHGGRIANSACKPSEAAVLYSMAPTAKQSDAEWAGDLNIGTQANFPSSPVSSMTMQSTLQFPFWALYNTSALPGSKTFMSHFETIIDSGTSSMYGLRDIVTRPYARAPALALQLTLRTASSPATLTYVAGVYDRPLSLSQDIGRAIITIVSQAFTIVYCAILALLTQRITLHEFIKRPQTLTAIHDKSSAWLGLGSSLQTLARQRKLVTDFLGISMITLYLLLIFVVHTTLPGIFSFTAQNITTFVDYPSTLARQAPPIVQENAFAANNEDYAILQVYDTLTLSTIGLWGSTLYDIIPVVEGATGAWVEVNATTFSVDCATLPDVVQTRFDPRTDDEPTYYFEFNGGKYNVSLSPFEDQQFKLLNVDDIDTSNFAPVTPISTLIVASTYPVIDAAGNDATIASMNPMWSDWDEPRQHPAINVSLIACNFNTQNSTISVNSVSRAVDKASAPPTPAHWHEWVDPGPSSDPMLLYALQRFVADEPNPIQLSDNNITLFNATFNMSLPAQDTLLIEWFLTTDITAYRNETGASQDIDSVTLGELNWSLARAYAAVLWSYNSIAAPDDVEFDSATIPHGQVSIPSSILQERLAVNKISLIAGLVASCALFVLTTIMVAKSGKFVRDAVHHDVSGLLPILWLLGNEPRLATMEEPDLDALRVAGTYIVTDVNKLRRRPVTTPDDAGEKYKFEDPS